MIFKMSLYVKKKSYFELVFFGAGFIFLIAPYHTLSSKTIKAETQTRKVPWRKTWLLIHDKCCLLAFSLLDAQPIFLLHKVTQRFHSSLLSLCSHFNNPLIKSTTGLPSQ